MQKYGYDFGNYATSSFKRRLTLIMKKNGIKTLDALIQRVLFDPAFFDHFILEITVNTTELFRDPTFFKFLRTNVLPVLDARPEFNIWHAACSTGEEALSMAILLKEENLLHRAKIYATDINHVVLKKAQSGRYPVRNQDLYKNNYNLSAPKGKLEDYYTVQDGEMVFSPELLENVRFKHHDLAVDHHFFKFDLILCRNVMIYFNQHLQSRVFDLLHSSMFLGGFLCLGAKESMIWCKIADKFETVNDVEKIYKKIKL